MVMARKRKRKLPDLLVVDIYHRIVASCEDNEQDVKKCFKELADEGYDDSMLMPYENDPDVWELFESGKVDEASQLLKELEGIS